MTKQYKTNVLLRAEVISDQWDRFALATKALANFDPTKQMDLMYVRACLVTSDINDNDDIFTRADLWAARNTPILKPMNWQHDDKDIVGVMYSVEAKTLAGRSLDMASDTPPEEDYELFVEAAIYKLIHADRADDIADRFSKGNIFVSMEAWFDDYDYGIVKGNVIEEIQRSSDTSFLDKQLRVNGGNGLHEANRIGRALRAITFGGCGFVDNPANKRSDVTHVQDQVTIADHDKQLTDLIRKLVSKGKEKETVLMTTQANDRESVKEAVAEAIKAQEARQKAEAATEKLEAQAATSEAKVGELQGQLVTSKSALEDSNKGATAQAEVLKARDTALDGLVQTIAGATGDTPPEIARLDTVTDGESAFNAKIAWIADTAKSLATKAARADELESELRDATVAFRENEVRELLSDFFVEDELTALVKIGASKPDGEYMTWLKEKQLFAAKMDKMEDKKDKNGKDKDGKKLPPFMKGSDIQNDNDVLDALIDRVAGKEHDVDPIPNGKDINSGVNPGSLLVPKDKIAGTASNDPNDALAGIQADDSGVNLAGASQSTADAEDGDPYGFKALASAVVDPVHEENSGEKGEK